MIPIPELGTRGTQLHQACATGSAVEIQRCLKRHQSALTPIMNMLTEDGQTALWILARRQQPTSIDCWKALLLQRRELQLEADPNIPWHGQTLLQYLTARNDAAVVLLLLQEGRVQANVPCVCNVGPLDMALRNLNAPLVRALAAYGEHCTYGQHNLPIPLRLPLSQATASTWNALLDTMEAYLLHVEVNAVGADGNSLLHLCALIGQSWAMKYPRANQIVRLMLLAGTDLNQTCKRDGKTALMQALETENNNFASALIQAGADVTVIDNQRRTCVFFAQDTKLIIQLKARGVNLEGHCRQGRTPLLDSIAEGRRIVPLLLAGADVTACDVLGRSSLHYAVAARRVEEASILSQPDCLHALGLREYLERLAIVQLLLAHHANPTVRDKSGNLPFFSLSMCSSTFTLVHFTDYTLSLLYDMVQAAAGAGLFDHMPASPTL